MSVYLGEDGVVLLKRKADTEGGLLSDLDPADVNPDLKRFSFDFPVEAIITGDRIEIFTLDKSNLELVAGHVEPDGAWYANIDEAGGVRLYKTFSDAVNGDKDKALPLVQPSATQAIGVRTRDNVFRCLAQMRQWEFTTSRANIDITTLGEEFVEQFTRGLVSGQGTLTCIWDYQYEKCDPTDYPKDAERAQYLCELLLRVRQGSVFEGQFFIYRGDPAVWYQCNCVITNVALSFAPGAVIDSRIDFVTTGPIHMTTGKPPGFLLLESGGLLLQEDEDRIAL